jgi:hypothetical protein
VIIDTAALAHVEHLIDDLVAEARSALARADIAEPTRGVLESLIGAATARRL